VRSRKAWWPSIRCWARETSSGSPIGIAARSTLGPRGQLSGKTCGSGTWLAALVSGAVAPGKQSKLNGTTHGTTGTAAPPGRRGLLDGGTAGQLNARKFLVWHSGAVAVGLARRHVPPDRRRERPRRQPVAATTTRPTLPGMRLKRATCSARSSPAW
jgi:hypothetical protein